ncbi:hypothetical protein CSW00_20290 [Pseudomonas asiatica]|nr:hypothetical protein CSW00_20290 [Pseudomonas sp. MR 02]
MPSPLGPRCRAENKYRSFEASFVGAALCCEEAGTSNRKALSVPASSQHKAAPTETAEPGVKHKPHQTSVCNAAR